MKRYKYIVLLISFIQIFIPNIISQTTNIHNINRERADLEPSHLKSSIENFFVNKKDKIYSTNGSPFNTKDNPQIDSVVIIKLNSGIEDEVIKYFYTYDTTGNVAIEMKKNYWRAINTYDSDNNIINFVWEIWGNNQWVNYALTTSNYDSSGNVIWDSFQLWRDTNWVNSSQARYFYNPNGDFSHYISEDWNGSGWVNSFKVTYTYDSNNVLITRLNQNWGGDDWDGITWRDSYTYDSNSNLILHLSEDLINEQWVNDIRWRYEYDENNNNILTFYDYWEDGKWKDDYRWTQDFDNDGNIIWYLEETYDLVKWTNSFQTFSTYNSKGHFSFARSERWIEDDSLWVPGNEGVFIYDFEGNRRSYFGSEIKVYYHDDPTDVTTSENPPDNFFLSQNYPNPFNPSTKIKFTIPNIETPYMASLQQTKLVVYDILGREVATLINKNLSVGNYEIKFDASSLPSGIYIYRLISGNFVKSKKMILLK